MKRCPAKLCAAPNPQPRKPHRVNRARQSSQSTRSKQSIITTSSIVTRPTPSKQPPRPRSKKCASSEIIAEVPSDLTEEEATALAEQVAEAQHEEAEREEREAREESAEESRDEDDSTTEITAATASEEYSNSEEQAEDQSDEGDDSAGNRFAAPGLESESESESTEDESPREGIEASAEAEADSAHEAASSEAAEPGAAPEAADIIVPLEGETVSGKPQEWRASVRGNFRARMHRRRRGSSGRSAADAIAVIAAAATVPATVRAAMIVGAARSTATRPRTAPRRPQLISEMLKAGQEIIVQIAKEPLGKKGARITSHVALPGRFLVYMPTVNHIGVSRRIGSAEERSRLRRLVTEAKGTFPGGFIVRTAAGAATPDEIRADVEFLGRTWEKSNPAETAQSAVPAASRSQSRRAHPARLRQQRLHRHLDRQRRGIQQGRRVRQPLPAEAGQSRQALHQGHADLRGVRHPAGARQGLRPKVWLKSGGYIVINHTEALVAIDVNTGKYVGRGSTRLEDTIVKTNLEAVKEIVRQIRLRDLGGIIVLDFIDMEERRNREKVMAALEQALRPTARRPKLCASTNSAWSRSRANAPSKPWSACSASPARTAPARAW